jgi:acyl-ACP thioesterase
VLDDALLDRLVPLPATGRVFERTRRVRLGDASPAGRLRLDALARYLQDVSNDDTRDAGLADEMTWVVRRTLVAVERFPVFGEELVLRTFCSGTGPRWAERRVVVRGSAGGRVEAATLWVFVDADGRPSPLPPGFQERFGAAAAGRTVRARLEHATAIDAAAQQQPWPLRFTDFDVLGHLNNASYWSAVEEVLSARRTLRAPLCAELEFRAGVERDADVVLHTCDSAAGVDVWLTDRGTVAATARVRSA